MREVRKSIFVLLSLLLLFYPVTNVYAGPKDELQKNMEELEKQKNEIIEKEEAARKITNKSASDAAVGKYIKGMDKASGLSTGSSLSSASSAAVSTTASVYSLIKVAVMIIVLLGGILSIAKLAMPGNGRSSREGKDGLKRMTLALIAMGAVGTIIVMVFKTANGIFY